MKKNLVYFILVLAVSSSCGQKVNLGNIINQVGSVLGSSALTEQEVGSGLKEALVKGISIGSDSASKLNGYFGNPKIKIPFPPEVQKVESTLRNIGLGSQVDKFVLSLNRGAEQAAQQAKPIFISAIKQLTITDAFNILKGDKDAATQFLKRTTSAQLTAAFQPHIETALNATDATKYYSNLAGAYNKLPFVTKINADLKGYATQRAIDGLFTLVAQEELKIRENPLARTTDLLKKVFASSN